MAELSDLTAQCIRCGFCLESCPTFVVSGMETESPRGRIYLARSMDEGVLPWNEENRAPLETCVGCRACETACPSGVKYGKILELTRSRFVEDARSRKDSRKLALLRTLTSPFLLRLMLSVGSLMPGRRVPAWLNRLIAGEESEADVPRLPQKHEWPPLDETAMPQIQGEVALLEGCAMAVLYPDVHKATERLLRRVGFRTVRVKGCCGALHAHAGFLKQGDRMAERIGSKVAAGAALVTNSAGCGCWLKESIGGADKAKVYDAAEFLAEKGLSGRLEEAPGLGCGPVIATYHQACHLAHGQQVREQPHRLLQGVSGLSLVPLEESDMCCGSGGAYNLLQPGHARKLLDRKWSNLAKTGASIVVTGNPGCLAWIAQAARENGGNVQVLHTLTLLEAAFTGSLT